MYVILYQDPITGKTLQVQHEKLESAIYAIKTAQDNLYYSGAAASEMIDPYKHQTPASESRSENKEEKKADPTPDDLEDYDYDFYPFQGY
jgi:hypothetical protein